MLWKTGRKKQPWKIRTILPQPLWKPNFLKIQELSVFSTNFYSMATFPKDDLFFLLKKTIRDYQHSI